MQVPGDKSMSHRALMLAAMTVGETRITGLLEGEDVLATAVRAAGAGRPTSIRPTTALGMSTGVGVGGLSEPDRVLDLGNSGTGVRLLTGLLAGHRFTSFLTGDASLSRRPMGRVIKPLSEIGASFLASERRSPAAGLDRQPTSLMPITYEQPVASAQVKSAVLLAGLNMHRAKPRSSNPHRHGTTPSACCGISAPRSVTEPLDDGRSAITVSGQPELSAVDLPGHRPIRRLQPS